MLDKLADHREDGQVLLSNEVSNVFLTELQQTLVWDASISFVAELLPAEIANCLRWAHTAKERKLEVVPQF
jgi:flagellar biosynthesis protein FlhB